MSAFHCRPALALTMMIGLLLGSCNAPPSVVPAEDAAAAPTAPAFQRRSAYAHPEALVNAAWLSGRLDDPAVRILDARAPFQSALYGMGHIPGALFVDVFSDVCCPSRIMDAGEFEALMGKLGIGDDTTVVVYDTDGGLWASRVWWALRYYGHEKVMVLNGGLQAWAQRKLRLETETPAVTPAVFHAETQPQWRATVEEVKAAIEDPEVAIVDSLTRPNFTGDLQQYKRAGHIASALSMPAPDTLDPVFRTVLSPLDLSRMLARLGLDPNQRVITYCGGGIYGSHTAFVLYLMGFDRVGLYDGSLMEWTADPSNPMEMD